MKKQLLALFAVAALALTLNAQTVSDFENPKLPAQGFLNGKQVTTVGRLISGGASFNNKFDTSFGGFWSQGIAVSNMRNDTTPGYGNLYSASTGIGHNSNNYAVAQSGTKVFVPGSKNVQGVYVTNSAYAYWSMKNGDGFAKKFGGTSGNDADSFILIAKGYNNGALINDEVRFTLADFTFANNSQDYIINQWTWMDLNLLSLADSISFSFESSDVGQFGINTPAFFAMDNFTMVDTGLTQIIATATFEEVQLKLDDFWNGKIKAPITGFANGNAFFNNSYNAGWDFWSQGFALSNVVDSTTAGFTNQYAAITGTGYNSSNYIVGTGGAKVVLTGIAAGKPVNGFYVTNNTYAYLSMKNGDQFAKKFGGVSGTEPDYFELIIKAHKDGFMRDSVVVTLADFRSNNSSEDYILNTWKWVDLLPMGDVDSLSFDFVSSDEGQFGMNTPAFFCMDNFTTKDAVSSPILTTGNVDPLICAGKTFNLAFTTSESFNTGNVFNAQLSDSNGNFTNAVNIGSLSAITNGTIAVTLPANAKGNLYKIRVVASNPNIVGVPSNTFAIGAKPQVSISGDSTVFQYVTYNYNVDSNTGSAYVWSFTNGTGTSVTSNIAITWNVIGNTTLKVVETSAAGCASDTAFKNITIKPQTGLNNATLLNVNVYPNPASNEVNIDLPLYETLNIKVTDVTGKSVMNVQNVQSIDVSKLSKGVYTMLIEADGKTASKRLIVQ